MKRAGPVVIPLRPRGFGETMRRDAWWVQPLVSSSSSAASSSTRPGPRFRARTTPSGRTSRRSTRRCSSATARTAGSAASRRGGRARCPFSPALLILWAPGGFRFTCYYYRGAYYKAFWADPPSCAVGEPRKTLPRRALVSADPPERPPLLPVPRAAVPGRPLPTTSGRRSGSPIATGQTTFGIGVGTLVLAVNVVLLGGYTFGCHSLAPSRRRAPGSALEHRPRS